MKEGIKVPAVRGKPRFTLAVILTGLLMLSHLIMSLSAPEKKLDELRSKYGADENTKNLPDETFLADSAYLSLLKEKAYYQSRVSMAASDSICMTVNLAGNTVNLEIGGVVVHSAGILKKSISSILKRDEYAILNMLSGPFTIASDISSIRKEPLMIKMAPRDTSEYQPDMIPDTTDIEQVNFILTMENGVKLYVYQYEKLKAGDNFHRFLFDFRDRLKTTAAALLRTITFRIPEYNPAIKIRLARADVKRIYRALPCHGQVGIYR
jgi:hypothetical protein